MSDETKNLDQTIEGVESGEKDTAAPSNSSRARNKTVMLTPEVTGQLRSLLNKEDNGGAGSGGVNDPLSDLLPPVNSWDKPGAASSSSIPALPAAIEAPALSGRAGGQRPSASVEQQVAAEPASTSFSVNKTAARVQEAPATSKIVGFFISFDESEHGEVFEIRAGRFLLTSRPTEHGDFILVDDPTISPLHAIIRATKDGTIQVLDQLSEFGTGVTAAGKKQEEDVSGSMIAVGHGDLIRFGKRNFVVCVVPEVSVKSKKDSEDKAE